jgi:iron complex outermembrane receptor protein
VSDRRFIESQCANRCLTVATILLLLLVTFLLLPGRDTVADDNLPTSNELAAGQASVDATLAQGAEPTAEPELDSELRELEQALERPAVAAAPSMEQEVTTVSGQQSTVGRSPAAVFVVTQEMIRRSGATCIPEVLRMVPGLQVARTNSHEWAITARGFNTNVAGLFASNNKLLVLIDGRTVYTPLYAGVNWDVQDLVLDDVERIEVIRGPGATLWGANAVNGVISIITKHAADTQGGLVRAGGGNFERGFGTARVGGQAADDVHYRVYGKWFERGPTGHRIGPEFDDWRQGRAGFRTDWTPNDVDLITLQGDYYEGRNGVARSPVFNPSNEDEVVTGGNVLTRWTGTLSDDSDYSLQFYYDRADRENRNLTFGQQIDTCDVDYRYHFPFGYRHNIVCGAGYRTVSDKLTPLTSPTVVFFEPGSRSYYMASVFVQDEIALVHDELYLTLGTKLLNSTFAPFEVQPSARLLWSPETSWATWAAVSRAVRTPSRVENDLMLNLVPLSPPPVIAFSESIESENLMAYEIGYREQPVEWFSWDVALFFNQYENLESFRNTPPIPPGLPLTNANDNRGAGYGGELSAQVVMTPYWNLSGWYSFLGLQLEGGPLSIQPGIDVEGSSPRNQAFLMSSHDLAENVQFDIIGRYVDDLAYQRVPHYISLDVRLAWHPIPDCEFAVVGQNLFDPQHSEFGGSPTRLPLNEIPRGVYGMVTRTW